MRPSPSYTSISTPSGASSAAARARAVLYDPARKRRIPIQPELGAVDGAGELDADSVVSIRVDACSDEAALQLDGPRDVLDRQLTFDDEFIASSLDSGRLEAELRISLRVEELR